MNLIDQLLEGLNTSSVPNSFTRGMGSLIRQAREEKGLSQRELASKIYRRQAALSEMENGLMQPDAETLLLLSYHLKKPIDYFYPSPYKPDPQPGELTEKENELIIHARRLNSDDFRKLIVQVIALADISE
jgi:transcriptional regulator with XRE-family HTH domain